MGQLDVLHRFEIEMKFIAKVLVLFAFEYGISDGNVQMNSERLFFSLKNEEIVRFSNHIETLHLDYVCIT